MILEDFSGIYCGFCPDGHRIAQNFKDANPNDVFIITAHAGPFAAPGVGDPDFRTSFGQALDAQADVIGYPAGTINRHLFNGMSQGNGTAMSRFSWVTAGNQILGQASPVNVGVQARIDVQTNQLIVDVEVYYTANSDSSTNMLNVALIQDDILGPQSGGGMGNNYMHQHMLRHLLTGQWGDTLYNTSATSFISKSYTYTLPSDYRGIELVPTHLNIIAFVSEGRHEILSGAEVHPMLTSPYSLDVGATDVKVDPVVCGGTMEPQVLIRNMGNDTLTAAAISYDVNGGTPGSYGWTGSLPIGEAEWVTLPQIFFSADTSNTFNVSVKFPNTGRDENPGNDTQSATFKDAKLSERLVFVEVKLDRFGSQTRWNIADPIGNIIHFGGPYQNNNATTVFQQINFTQSGCHTFTIFDSNGDGLQSDGSYRLVDAAGTLLASGGQFASEESTPFYIKAGTAIDEQDLVEGLKVYPNPVTDLAHISFELINAEQVSLELVNLMGQKLRTVELGQLGAGKHEASLDASGLPSGIYFLNLRIGEANVSRKLSLK